MYYAIPNKSDQYCGPADLMPAGAILMQYERPTPEAVAQADGTWILPVPTYTREQTKEKINNIKNTKRDAGFVVGTTKFDSDQPARVAYAELAMRFMQDPTFTTRWKASDGVWVDMTKELFDAVYTAGAEHIASAFAWQAEKEAELAALADDNLYDFYTGLSYA